MKAGVPCQTVHSSSDGLARLAASEGPVILLTPLHCISIETPTSGRVQQNGSLANG